MVLVTKGSAYRTRTRTSERILATSSNPRGNLGQLPTTGYTYCHINGCEATIPPEAISGNRGTCPMCRIKTCVTCKGPAHGYACAGIFDSHGFPSDYTRSDETLLPKAENASTRGASIRHRRANPYGSHMYEDGKGHIRRIQGALTELECARYLAYKHRSRKDKGKDGKEVWPDHLEEAFQIALRMIPPIGRRKTPLTQLDTGATKSSGRNELLARKLWLLTGEIRSRKQISSHIQVLKNLIMDEDWLQHVQSAPSKDEREVSRNFHFDEVRGELVFTDYPTTTAQHHRTVASRTSADLLPPATMTLRSSVPSQIPFVQKIELNMSVFPPATEHSKDGPAYHTYTRMQSEMGAQPITSEGDPFWRERYPEIANLYDGDGQPKTSEIILLESNLELMKTFCPQRSKLGIHLYADIICDGAYKTWNHRTTFHQDDQPSTEYARNVVSTRTHNSTTTRVEISLFSSWWVELFQEILNRRHAIEISGDLEELQDHEDQTREYIRSCSVVQEIFASTQEQGHEFPLTGHPAVILLWKFRQTGPGEAATTSWRKLHVSSSRASVSIELEPLEQQLAMDPRAPSLTDRLALPLPSSQVQLPEPLQNGARWDEWSHVPRDPYAKSTDSMIMNVPRNLFYEKANMVDFRADQTSQIGTSVYLEQPLFQNTTTPTYSGENYNEHYGAQTAHTTQQPDHYFSSNPIGTISFASQGSEQQVHSFSSNDAAASILTDLASQGTAAEFSSQSTTADLASHLENTDLTPEQALDYSQETTDPSLDDFASCQIELSFQHDPLHDHAQVGYDDTTLAAPVADMLPLEARPPQNEPYHGEQHPHEQFYNEQQQHGRHHQRQQHHMEMYSSHEPHTGTYGSATNKLLPEGGKPHYTTSFYDAQTEPNHAEEARDMMLRDNTAVDTQAYANANGDSQLQPDVEPGMTFEQYEQYQAQQDECRRSFKVGDWNEMIKNTAEYYIHYGQDPAPHVKQLEELAEMWPRVEEIRAQILGHSSVEENQEESGGQGKVLGELEEGKEGLGEIVS